MLKIEINTSRDVLHYILEKLATIEVIEDVRVILTESMQLKSTTKFDTINTVKIEFVAEKNAIDSIIQLLLTDTKIHDGRIDIINVEQSLMLGSKESKKIKILLPAFIKAYRKDIYNFVTNYTRLPDELPEYIKSVDIINRNENVSIVEEEVSIDGVTIKHLTRHTVYAPAVHETEILSGHLEGSRIIETYTELVNGTEILIIGEFRIAKELESIIGTNLKTRIENSIRRIITHVTKIIESKYGIKD